MAESIFTTNEDYRALLKRFLKHIVDIEGHTYISDTNRVTGECLSEEDQSLLSYLLYEEEPC